MDEKEKQLQTISNLENSIASNKKGMMITLVMAVVSFSIACYGWCFEKSFLILIGGIATFALIWLYCQLYSGMKKMEKDLSSARSNYGKYLKDQEHIKELRKAERLQQARIEGAQHPQCPMCGSLQTQRITTAKRAASVYAVGLASDKIGKQFECKACKYKW